MINLTYGWQGSTGRFFRHFLLEDNSLELLIAFLFMGPFLNRGLPQKERIKSTFVLLFLHLYVFLKMGLLWSYQDTKFSPF